MWRWLKQGNGGPSVAFCWKTDWGFGIVRRSEEEENGNGGGLVVACLLLLTGLEWDLMVLGQCFGRGSPEMAKVKGSGSWLVAMGRKSGKRKRGHLGGVLEVFWPEFKVSRGRFWVGDGCCLSEIGVTGGHFREEWV
ncbi:hypothetical protein KY285_023773 [Solanum tuberosum]|nr:hypothetical protein KY289_024103 [Solanum tuberosum]KAH0675972.1 hypothetical protein KY285_023773 [Solanum tuberosum]